MAQGSRCPGILALLLACACARDPDPGAPVDPAPTLDAHPAVGSLAELPGPLAAAFADTEHFAPLREPGPNDWLSARTEPGQTVAQYLAKDPLRPSPERHVIYLQPIGPFTLLAPSIDTLASYTEAFFGLDVAVLEPITSASLGATTREWDYGTQLRTDDVLTSLAGQLPDDAFLLIGLTMTDLYPGDDWNFVFGYASLDRRVAVYSLLRFDPLLDDPRVELSEAQRRELILRRSLKVMSHELTHSFGMRHCIYYDCLMNGANHLGETDEHPMHLCPVCLRKLNLATDLDPTDHYRRLAAFYVEHRIADEAAWVDARLAYLREAGE